LFSVTDNILHHCPPDPGTRLTSDGLVLGSDGLTSDELAEDLVRSEGLVLGSVGLKSWVLTKTFFGGVGSARSRVGVAQRVSGDGLRSYVIGLLLPIGKLRGGSGGSEHLKRRWFAATWGVRGGAGKSCAPWEKERSESFSPFMLLLTVFKVIMAELARESTAVENITLRLFFSKSGVGTRHSALK
jgi:hypothetical protein